MRSEGGGAVFKEDFLPEVKEIDGDAVFLADLGDGYFFNEVLSEQCDFLFGAESNALDQVRVPLEGVCQRHRQAFQRVGARPAYGSQLIDAAFQFAARDQVTFLLTTNRPEVLEPALAARLGRVELANCAD